MKKIELLEMMMRELTLQSSIIFKSIPLDRLHISIAGVVVVVVSYKRLESSTYQLSLD